MSLAGIIGKKLSEKLPKAAKVAEAALDLGSDLMHRRPKGGRISDVRAETAILKKHEAGMQHFLEQVRRPDAPVSTLRYAQRVTAGSEARPRYVRYLPHQVSYRAAGTTKGRMRDAIVEALNTEARINNTSFAIHGVAEQRMLRAAQRRSNQQAVQNELTGLFRGWQQQQDVAYSRALDRAADRRAALGISEGVSHDELADEAGFEAYIMKKYGRKPTKVED